MQEWFNWHAWKACVPQKGTGGSNPPLSADSNYSRSLLRDFYFTFGRAMLRMSEVRGKIKTLTNEMSKGVIWICKVPPKGSPQVIPLSPQSLH